MEDTTRPPGPQRRPGRAGAAVGALHAAARALTGGPPPRPRLPPAGPLHPRRLHLAAPSGAPPWSGRSADRGVTAVQRFGGTINLNVHFHTLVPDRVFDLEGDGPAWFVEVGCPSDEELTTILTRFIRRAAKVLARFDDEAETEADALASPALSSRVEPHRVGVEQAQGAPQGHRRSRPSGPRLRHQAHQESAYARRLGRLVRPLRLPSAGSMRVITAMRPRPCGSGVDGGLLTDSLTVAGSPVCWEAMQHERPASRPRGCPCP